ncbi:dihydrodipicolinate synthase family protein [Schinkia azotoformans]|uniref:dihydrodipicolinate synthase family protein n=1 Tax=Schinkia azotoformans TaxID=1454 RepID=UPI002E1D4BFC|nr:dihydrodipicolinate synthase family protein [Schinkia azotoformans]
MSVDFHGIIPYLVSPIDKSTGNVKTETLTKLVKDLLAKGVHGLSPLGSTGEVHYLTSNQKSEIVRTVIEAAEGKVPVIPGVTAYTPTEAIEQINNYEKLGADGVVIILETYFTLSKKEIQDFFKTVARSVSCQIVLYNNPKFSSVDLTPEIILKLAQEPNINYFKDATGNTGRLLSIINQAGNQIKIFSASAHIPLFVMQLGGVGWMAGPACIFPEQSVYLYNLASLGRWEEALEAQKQLWSANEIFQKYNLASCIKTGLEIQGYDVGDPIPPLKPLDKDAIDVIRNILNRASL